MQVDVLHPLISLESSKCQNLPVCVSHAQAVWWNDAVYVGGGCTSIDNDAFLYIYNLTADIWKSISAPAYNFALTTYHSRLLIIGGKMHEGEHVIVTNKIWSLGRDTMAWELNLPAMTTKRHSASAVEYMDNVIVAGGACKLIMSDTDVVEVYNGQCWCQVQCLPKPCSDIKSTVHNGHWYLAGKWGNQVYHASLKELISQGKNVWKLPLPELPTNIHVLPGHTYTPFTPILFGNRLLAIAGWNTPTPSIFCFSSHINSWILRTHNIEMENTFASSMIVLPTGELMVIGGFSGKCPVDNVIKVTLKGKYPQDTFWNYSSFPTRLILKCFSREHSVKLNYTINVLSLSKRVVGMPPPPDCAVHYSCLDILHINLICFTCIITGKYFGCIPDIAKYRA